MATTGSTRRQPQSLETRNLQVQDNWELVGFEISCVHVHRYQNKATRKQVQVDSANDSDGDDGDDDVSEISLEGLSGVFSSESRLSTSGTSSRDTGTGTGTGNGRVADESTKDHLNPKCKYEESCVSAPDQLGYEQAASRFASFPYSSANAGTGTGRSRSTRSTPHNIDQTNDRSPTSSRLVHSRGMAPVHIPKPVPFDEERRYSSAPTQSQSSRPNLPVMIKRRYSLSEASESYSQTMQDLGCPRQLFIQNTTQRMPRRVSLEYGDGSTPQATPSNSPGHSYQPKSISLDFGKLSRSNSIGSKTARASFRRQEHASSFRMPRRVSIEYHQTTTMGSNSETHSTENVVQSSKVLIRRGSLDFSVGTSNLPRRRSSSTGAAAANSQQGILGMTPTTFPFFEGDMKI
ncbi:expressed unknown protein [Seminavis robusta]|uniref:Uncharacterized protein n=1 Tax=Seminavis robusta TaxID=568900 RepID=A0A9N8HDY3_9STRA|nr:expressed unknown protein [Seminavis robusta]|eukprot:Sro363_g126910.1 n/a (405) ;mRNA; f:41879-43093